MTQLGLDKRAVPFTFSIASTSGSGVQAEATVKAKGTHVRTNQLKID